MTNIREFTDKFGFREDGRLLVGIERECFLRRGGDISPIAEEVLILLQRLGSVDRFGFELSACQLEDRIGPVELTDVRTELERNERMIHTAEGALNFSRSFEPVASSDMPLDVFPDPTGRYQKITKEMPEKILRAACRVIGTHIHIGMPNKAVALAVYSRVSKEWQRLCNMGGPENQKRLDIYKIMAPDFVPREYDSWRDFYLYAICNNFVNNPRSCWHLIRMSVHGTIEFRMFPATQDLDQIVTWANLCHHLCEQAMK